MEVSAERRAGWERAGRRIGKNRCDDGHPLICKGIVVDAQRLEVSQETQPRWEGDEAISASYCQRVPL